MNPAAMFKIMQAKNTFTKNHPKFEAFLRNVMADKIVEGTGDRGIDPAPR